MPVGKEQKLYEVGATDAVCHCPQQNIQPFKKIQTIWQKDTRLGFKSKFMCRIIKFSSHQTTMFGSIVA